MKLPLIVGIIALLAVAGAGLYVTEFFTYLGNNPTTCNNCHVMDAVYERWYHAGHKQWATCNDCHTPHPLIRKYIVKATSGYHHVTAFFFGDIPVSIRAKESSQEIIQENCIRCHEAKVVNILDSSMKFDRKCYDCHRSAAHGERGISLLPYQHKEEQE